jgi:hypothetical protein
LDPDSKGSLDPDSQFGSGRFEQKWLQKWKKLSWFEEPDILSVELEAYLGASKSFIGGINCIFFIKNLFVF